MVRFLLSLVLALLSLTTWSATLEGVRLSDNGDHTRLVFDLSDSVQYKTFTLAHPDRLVIDLESSKKTNNLSLPSLAGTPIRDIRSGTWKHSTLRVVLDLDQSLHYETQTLAAAGDAPDRLVVDLHQTQADPTSGGSANEPTPAPAKQVRITAPTQKRDLIIAIDPGHGGKDSGAIGPGGIMEKNVTLAIGRKLSALIAREPGMKPFMTRHSDVFITLRGRIELARQHHADLFVSIHADSFPSNPQVRGASVYVLSERGASSEAAHVLANRENAADLAGGVSLDDKDNLLASVLLDLSQTASLDASLKVADNVLSDLKQIGHVHRNHVESAAFVVLKSPDIPSILVETAYITNPHEARLLTSSGYQGKLAHAILGGIRSYFRKNPLPGTRHIGQQHIVSRGDTLSTIAQRYRVSMADLKSTNNLSSSTLQIGEVLKIP